MKVGATDVFERSYVQRFRERFKEYGEFLNYERDRAARDIGLHLTRPAPGGGQLVSSAVCWFQLKGITTRALNKEALAKMSEVRISLDVVHLKFWFLQPQPTYLGLYLECADTFLVVNLREYVSREWGRGIFSDKHKTRTVRVPTSSTLDSTALWQILRDQDAQEWARVFSTSPEDARLAVEDYMLIWRLGTAADRGVAHLLQIIDWQSKMRTELRVREVEADGTTKNVHQYWEYMGEPAAMLARMPHVRLHRVSRSVAFAVPAKHPFLVAEILEALEPEEEDEWLDEEDDPQLQLPDIGWISGVDRYGEAHEYVVGLALSDVGILMFAWIQQMVEAEAIAIDLDEASFISHAPWHARSV